MAFIIFHFFFFNSIHIVGQSNNLNTNQENLLPNCSELSIPDHLDIDYETEMSFELSDKHQSIEEYKQLYCFAKKKNNKKLLALSLFKMGNFGLYRGGVPLENALYYLEKSIEISTEISFWDCVLAVKEVQSSVFTTNNLLSTAEYISNEFLEIAQKIQDSIRIGEGHMLLGRVKRYQKEYAKSKEHLQKALIFSNGSDNFSKHTKAFTYLHLSHLYNEQQQYKLAKEYALKGREFSKNLEQFPYYINAFFTYAIVINNIELGIYDNLPLLQDAKIEIVEQIFLKADIYYAYGLTYEKQGDIKNAILAYQKCIDYSIESSLWSSFTLAYSRVIPLINTETKLPNNIALLVKSSEKILQDKLLVNTQENVFRLNYGKFENEKNKAKLLASQLENSRKMNIFALALATLFIILTLSVYFQFRTKNKLNKKITKLNQQLEVRNEELLFRSNFISDANLRLENLMKHRNKIIERLKKFTNVLAHDFKEPLVTIITLGKIITNTDSEKISKNKTQEFLGYIIEASQRLNDMVERLYKYGNDTLKISEVFETVNLNKTIELIQKDLHFKIKELDATISSSSLHAIKGDRILIYQLFQNLVSNSLKYSQKDKAPKIKIQSTVKDNGVLVTIKDNGIGIPDNPNLDIFNKGTRVNMKQDSNGIGLGLATCKEIMEIHFGKIWYTSDINRGTTFHLFFEDSKENDLTQVL